ncbi:MAG: helix-turn-helix domain-containing protein [Victivallales bacterium]
MKYIIKSPAPALEKGIQALTRLSENGPRNLEKLSKDLGEPKASLLRYLDTLLSLGLVGRDPVTKEYSSKVAMVRLGRAGRDFSDKVQKLLDSLAEKTCRTAEWYVHNGDRMVLARRSEPENAVIHVKAKIGFERELNGEFEAVARIAILNLKIDLSGKKSWIYRDGRKKNIEESICRKILDSDRKNGYAIDMEYNENGVRRYAAPVFQNGKLAGVIALAENFRPDADSKIPRIAKMLKDEIKDNI